MDRDFEKKLMTIIETYIDALEAYESDFRNRLSKTLGGISPERLRSLPSDMWSSVSGLQNEYWMLNIFQDSKYAQDYYDKTLKTFQESGINLSPDAENGVIFEGLLLESLKESSNMDINYSTLPSVRLKYDYEGIGFLKKHGDIAFMINGIKLPVLIDAKYSSDRSQIISTLSQHFNNTTDLEKQLVTEIHRGLSESISFNKNQGYEWIKDYVNAKQLKEKGQIGEAKNVFLKGVKVPKILIYVFKDKGLWSSQVVKELEGRVIENAKVIRQKNNKASIGGSFTKDWLWYGVSKSK